MFVINNIEHNIVPPSVCYSLSYCGSPHQSSCQQHSYIQYIILTVQTSTAVHMLVASNTGLDTLLLPPACSLSHSGSHTHMPSTLVSQLNEHICSCACCWQCQTQCSTLSSGCSIELTTSALLSTPLTCPAHCSHNTNEHVLIAGNIKLDTQCFLLAALSHIQFHYFSCIAVHLFTCSSLTCHLAPSFSCSILYVGPLHQSSHQQHPHMKPITFSPNDCLLPCA